MKKKKAFIIIVIVLALVILLFPIRMNLKDGGSVSYKSIVYEITKLHQLGGNNDVKPYIDGFEVKILGRTVYRNTNEAENAKETSDIKNTINGNWKTYYEMTDGTWMCNDITYKKRLVITGRLNNAVCDSSYVYLSNLENITFEQAWKASGLSSSMEDYFKPEDAVLVELPIDIEYQKVSSLKATNVDTTALVKFNDKLFGKSLSIIDYAGGGEPIGEISKLIDKDLIPQFNEETNNEELVGALVYECGTEGVALYYDNTYRLFEVIE